jgi:hypothetical protein
MFWTADTEVGGYGFAPYHALTVKQESAYLAIQFPSRMPVEEQLAIADRVLAGVQRWRDGIADELKRERTSADELAVALRRIAELEQQSAGGVDE